MIPYILGGIAVLLLGKHFLSKPSQTPAQQAAQQQSADAIRKAAARMGITPAAPPETAADKLKKLLPWQSSGHAPPQTARLMQGDPLNTVQGKTYWVTLQMHGLAASAGRDSVVDEATSRGFTDIVPSPTRPKDWPGQAQGDWYVKAKAARPNQFARQKGSAFAGVNIIEAFEA